VIDDASSDPTEPAPTDAPPEVGAPRSAAARRFAPPPRASLKRRCLRGLTTGLVACGLLLGLGGGCMSRAVIFPGSPHALPPGGRLLSRAPHAEVVAYETEDGISLRGILALAGAASERAGTDGTGGASPSGPPVLVYFHGNAESAVLNLDLALAFARSGLNVFVAEYRGYGGAPGSPSEEGLLIDGRAALRVVEERLGVPPADVVLVGRSLGTGVASGLAGMGFGRAVVLISPYTSLLDVAQGIVPRWVAWLALRDRFDNVEALSQVTHPVLVIHGDQDQVIPYALGARLAEGLGPRARLITLEGVEHNGIYADAGGRILTEIAAFARATKLRAP